MNWQEFSGRTDRHGDLEIRQQGSTQTIIYRGPIKNLKLVENEIHIELEWTAKQDSTKPNQWELVEETLTLITDAPIWKDTGDRIIVRLPGKQKFEALITIYNKPDNLDAHRVKGHPSFGLNFKLKDPLPQTP